LSRWRLRVREEKMEGVWICCCDWNPSRAMRDEEGGDERRDEEVEISESERFLLRNIVVELGG
jgi:hypothetical protein